MAPDKDPTNSKSLQTVAPINHYLSSSGVTHCTGVENKITYFVATTLQKMDFTLFLHCNPERYQEPFISIIAQP